MCGIAGIQRFDGQPVRREVLDAMVATFDHRGPDANGIELRGSVGLGHTRLSIIDLSDGELCGLGSSSRVAATSNRLPHGRW
ncbi:hypothetical protein LBMAG52_38950 [Planctomycetia bacterium]|nr:hypothetical protein LBMAG52_38950 [Planctomycetia bacterium]